VLNSTQPVNILNKKLKFCAMHSSQTDLTTNASTLLYIFY